MKWSLDLEAAREAIYRATGASWWDWDIGSRPFHWRWPEFYQGIVRDGLPIYMAARAPIYRVAQKDTKDEDYKLIMVKKLTKV